MRSSRWRFVVAVAVCTLLPVIAANAKDKITRPFQMAAHSQLVVVVDPGDPSYGTYVAHAEGVASHLGQVTADESGILLPITHGTMTAANGDSLNYDFNSVTAVGGWLATEATAPTAITEPTGGLRSGCVEGDCPGVPYRTAAPGASPVSCVLGHCSHAGSNMEIPAKKEVARMVLENRIRVAPNTVAYADGARNKLVMEFAIPGAPTDTIDLKLLPDSVHLTAPARDIEYVSALAIAWPVKPEKAEAIYEHGLLRIEVPFKDPMEDAVKVAITAGGVEAEARRIEP